MATHSSVLAWRIPGTGDPGGLPSMGSHRVGHNWSDLAAAAYSLLGTRLGQLQGWWQATFAVYWNGRQHVFLPTLWTNSMAKVCMWLCVCDSFDDIIKNVHCPSCWRLSPLLLLRKQLTTLESSLWQGTGSGFENHRGASSQWAVQVSASIQQDKEFLSSAITRKLILPTVWVILEEAPSPVEPQMRL